LPDFVTLYVRVFASEAQKAKLVSIALAHIGEVTELIVIAGQRNRKVVYRLHEG